MEAFNEIVQQRTSEEVSEWLTTMGSPYNEYAKAFLGEYKLSLPCSSCVPTGGLESTRECFCITCKFFTGPRQFPTWIWIAYVYTTNSSYSNWSVNKVVAFLMSPAILLLNFMQRGATNTDTGRGTTKQNREIHFGFVSNSARWRGESISSPKVTSREASPWIFYHHFVMSICRFQG